MIDELIKLASDLDEKGLHEEVDQLDSVIQRMGEAQKEDGTVKESEEEK